MAWSTARLPPPLVLSGGNIAAERAVSPRKEEI